VTEKALYIDLSRLVDDSLDRALRLGRSWDTDHVFVCEQDHRLHTVCSTLEALNYTRRRFGVSEREGQSAWSLTSQGVELYHELRSIHNPHHRRKNAGLI